MANITNRSAKQHYEILETVSAGISLLGSEVKSLREGKGSLVGSKVLIRDNEAFLVGSSIPPYQEKNAPSSYDKDRTRRLLLTKKEIDNLNMKIEAKNLTIVPIKIYNSGRLLKIDIGIARKKNARDKREDIKRRDSERSIRRSIKS